MENLICQATGASHCELGPVIQQLWSGYGVIQKVKLTGDRILPAVVKYVDLSASRANRRGWDGDVSHQRKVKSYQVEQKFYRSFSHRCGPDARVPKLLGTLQLDAGQGWVIVLEDLDASGFSGPKKRCSMEDVSHCMSWLASFHATFMHDGAKGLWDVGTYWHLATRPDELSAMDNRRLQDAAKAIDQTLAQCKFQTLVHGDAKLANFCFADRSISEKQNAAEQVAAVDFQYVGRGCGMKDVVYFLTSCLNDQQCDRDHEMLLDRYFRYLKDFLGNAFEHFEELEDEWRSMFPMAWADFNRFLNGWSPGHWKLTPFSQRLTDDALEMLERIE